MIATSVGPAVALIQSERLIAERQGGKAWDTPGIRAALTACDGPLPDVMRAALIAAEDPSLHAPSVEAFRVRWQRPPAPAPAPRGVPCPEHRDHLVPCPACRAELDAADPVDPAFVEALKAQAAEKARQLGGAR